MVVGRNLRCGAVCVLLAVGTACGANSQAAQPTDVPATDTTTQPFTTAPEAQPDDTETATSVTRPILPRVPAVRPPDVSSLTQAGDRVAERLGDLVSPEGGIEVVGATCAEGGGELQYGTGSTGEDVFDIDADGAGTYFEESHDGLTTLEVLHDGSGRFYDERRDALVTIAVEPDRSGEYYQRHDDDLVTVRVAADGSGEYYSETEDRLLTITLEADGSGRLYDKREETLLTIDARGDGSGEFFRKTPADVATIVVETDGSWEYTYSASSSVITLEVDADGSGSYDEAGLESIEFDFDSQGRGPDGQKIVLPPTPDLVVASEFAPLGTLGSLAPPCATVIRLDSSVLFDFGKAELRPEADPVLDEVVDVLSESDKPIDIVGHTDSIGTDEDNLELSLDRARAVETALRDRGLDVDISIDGRGESEPVAPNETPDGEDDPAGRAQNRRVDITIRES